MDTDESALSQNLENLLEKPIPIHLKALMKLNIFLWLFSIIFSIIFYFLYKHGIFSFHYDECESLQINFYLIFICLIIIFFSTYIPLCLVCFINSNKFYSILKYYKTRNFSIGMMFLSLYNIFSSFLEKTILYEVFVFLLLSISLILLFSVYYEFTKITFDKIFYILAFRAFLGLNISFYFYFLLYYIRRYLEQFFIKDNLSIIINITYGFCCLYVISILQESFFSFMPIILELGGILNNSEKSNIICNVFLTSLLLIALIINCTRFKKKETFGLFEYEFGEKLFESEKNHKESNANERPYELLLIK